MNRLQPKAVIFDLGSTLIEYESETWDILSRKCALSVFSYLSKHEGAFQLPLEEEFVEKLEEAKSCYREEAFNTHVEWRINQALADLLTSLKIVSEDGIVDNLFEAFYTPVREQLYVYDDTVSTLERIREAHPIIGLVSNTIFPEKIHLAELKRFGIASFFDFTIFSSTFGKRKPHPDIFRKAANLAGYAPAECVYIGDRYMEDIEGPTGIGMPAILKVKSNREYPEDMPLADRRIDKLAELRDHFSF